MIMDRQIWERSIKGTSGHKIFPSTPGVIQFQAYTIDKIFIREP